MNTFGSNFETDTRDSIILVPRSNEIDLQMGSAGESLCCLAQPRRRCLLNLADGKNPTTQQNKLHVRIRRHPSIYYMYDRTSWYVTRIKPLLLQVGVGKVS